MDQHHHARLTPRGRALLVLRIPVNGLRVEEAARAAGVMRLAFRSAKIGMLPLQSRVPVIGQKMD